MRRNGASRKRSADRGRGGRWLPAAVERLESRYAMDGEGMAPPVILMPPKCGLPAVQSLTQSSPKGSPAAMVPVDDHSMQSPGIQTTGPSAAGKPSVNTPESYSPGWVLPPSMPVGPVSNPPWIGPPTEPTPEEIRVQDRLNYLQSILGRFVAHGDMIAAGDLCANYPQESFNSEEWAILREHILHAMEYRTTKLVALRNGSSTNLPFSPGFYLDAEAFYGQDLTALEVLVHEPMHDLDWLGPGHSWPFNNLDEIVGPHTSDNMFNRFTDYLQKTRYAGRSLWTIILDQSRDQGGSAAADTRSFPLLNP